jgi:hypothetical protein
MKYGKMVENSSTEGVVPVTGMELTREVLFLHHSYYFLQ